MKPLNRALLSTCKARYPIRAAYAYLFYGFDGLLLEFYCPTDSEDSDRHTFICQLLALLPSFEVIGWTIQVFGPVFITGHSIMYTVATDIPVTLISALNPIGTILLVAPYRRAVFRYFGITKAQSTVIRIRTTIQTTVRRYGTASIHPVGRSGN
uniref:G protein-coupled receptor n=1 Tax=Meloidogyne javanica TaxID=6303 RepID=A0A915NE53_MELJA